MVIEVWNRCLDLSRKDFQDRGGCLLEVYVETKTSAPAKILQSFAVLAGRLLSYMQDDRNFRNAPGSSGSILHHIYTQVLVF